MIDVITTEKKPIKLWLDSIEDGALLQAKNLANLPFAFHHIAIMPDAHQGYGMPIGAVMTTRDVIVPNAVGVDIGCGVVVAKTSIKDFELDEEVIKKLFGGSKEYKGGIRSKIPVGMKRHSKKQGEEWMPKPHPLTPVVMAQYESALNQIGTLGGGNHFIEIQADNTGSVWVMIHSGSRNIGYQVAKFYNDEAKRLNEKWFSSVPIYQDLAFLPLESELGHRYLHEMEYCVEFASKSRELMLERVMESFCDIFGKVEFSTHIDAIHNYAALEHHFGKNVMVYRKGAIRAREDDFGIIPGSQGSSSYIVRGLGHPDSFKSCSHGAGRQMGRKQAQRELDFDAEVAALEGMGIVHSVRNAKDLDEAPGAYKDIYEVMGLQSDLVSVEFELRPLAVIKG